MTANSSRSRRTTRKTPDSDGVYRWNIKKQSVREQDWYGHRMVTRPTIDNVNLRHCNGYYKHIGTTARQASREAGVDLCLSRIEPATTPHFESSVWFVTSVCGTKVYVCRMRRVSTGVGFVPDTKRAYVLDTKLPGHSFQPGDLLYQWCEY